MLRLNRLTDYAIVLLGQMSQDVGRVRTASALAEATGVPLPTVSKLLKILAAENLVTSHRGASGGYSLDRGGEALSVAEIVQALDGPIAVTACVDGAEDGCEVEATCPMSGNWNRVNDAIRTALECVSLADMTNPEGLFPRPTPNTQRDDDTTGLTEERA